TARQGMALPGFGKPRVEAALGDLSGRLGGQDAVKRRTPDACRACIVGARGNQHRAAIADIFCNIVEIDERQYALPRVAIKNDQLEFRDLLLEKLARGKRY